MSKAKDREPKVVMFGEEVSEDMKGCGSCDGGGSAWGVFFIFLGILFLCNTMGIIPWSVWEMLKQFWPVIFILIGLDTIFGRSGIGRVVNTLVGLWLFGTILGVVFFRVAPQLITMLPIEVLNYFASVSKLIPYSL